MSLIADIGQGAGLAGATGVRPFLPPLLTGALARGDIGVDFDGTGWHFLESPVFLLAVLVLAVLSYGAERSAANRELAAGEPAHGRGPVELLVIVLALALGAMLFAGSLAAGGREAWPGLLAGLACAALGWAAIGGLFERAARRLERSSAGLLVVYAEGIALGLAALAVAIPVLSFAALLAFLVLLARGRRAAARKFAGLRVLR